MKKILCLFLFVPSFVVASFSDDDQIPDWAFESIQNLVEDEIFSGNPDGTFAPNRSLNRAEFCKILIQATDINLYEGMQASFPDVETDQWFFSYVETAKREGWLAGYPDGLFRPGNTLNRAEAAKILVGAFDLEVESLRSGEAWFQPYFRALEDADLLAHGARFDFLESDHKPSRAEIAEQLHRVLETMEADEAEEIMEEEEEIIELPEPVVEAPKTSSSGGVNTMPTDFVAPAAPVSQVNTRAGDLKITKDSQLERNAAVVPGATRVKAHSLLFSVIGEPVIVDTLQFRRVGNGSFADFAQAWVEVDGIVLSEKVEITEDLVSLPLKSSLTIRSGMRNFVLRVNVASGAGSGSSRFVLFLPEWIGADARNRIGLFPFGGADIVIE